MNDDGGTIYALKFACRRHPAERVGQVLINAVGEGALFYMSNEELRSLLFTYAESQP